MKAKLFSTLATLICCATAGSANAAAPTAAALTTALNEYLATQGQLCVGKFTWPIDVSADDVSAATRDAVQMPVLQQLGLVAATDALAMRKQGADAAMVPVKRYALTEKGKKFYLPKQTVSVAANGSQVLHPNDFCAGKLSLDKIVAWDAPQTHGDNQELTVTYTYKIAAADWARDPQAQKVFPMVERIVNGQSSLQLKQRFRMAGSGWTAVTQLD